MKLLFVCGCLEPGKDGVGDYTCRLGGELYRQGNQVSVIALNDSYIQEELFRLQIIEDLPIPTLRIPTTYPSNNRFNRAKKWIDEFQPDWISLQFVPFSFQKHGLPFNLARNLKRIIGSTKIHIMFHELWVGIHGKTTKKQALLGFIQKLNIMCLNTILQPKILTTSNSIYKSKLHNDKAVILSLFGNIPISNNESYLQPNNKILTVVHFGTFTNCIADFIQQVEAIQQIAVSKNSNLKFILLGNGGAHKKKYLDTLKRMLGSEAINDMGMLSSEEISQYLLRADIGISRADYDIVGKSGSTLAMIEHGLPVLLRGERPKQVHNELKNLQELLFFCDDTPHNIPKKKKPKSLILEVSLHFSELLVKS